MAKTTFTVVRLSAGGWHYYAGRNEALGAIRWDTMALNAQRFATRRAAERVARQVNGFVRTARPQNVS